MARALGDQELELLRFVADKGPCTVRWTADTFGVEAGLARTTVLTMMERLRRKGYLVREEGDGAFLYRTAESKGEVMREVVGDFVRKTLGGSVSPFVAYLAQGQKLSHDEVRQLRELVDRLEEDES